MFNVTTVAVQLLEQASRPPYIPYDYTSDRQTIQTINKNNDDTLIDEIWCATETSTPVPSTNYIVFTITTIINSYDNNDG